MRCNARNACPAAGLKGDLIAHPNPGGLIIKSFSTFAIHPKHLHLFLSPCIPYGYDPPVHFLRKLFPRCYPYSRSGSTQGSAKPQTALLCPALSRSGLLNESATSRICEVSCYPANIVDVEFEQASSLPAVGSWAFQADMILLLRIGIGIPSN